MDANGHDLAAGEDRPRPPQSEVVDGEPADHEPTREQLISILARSEFSGPLPPPAMLARYNEALPDGADRIVKMAEQQSMHRQRIESRGQIFGFTLAMTAIVGGIVLISVGRSTEGLVPLVSAIAGLTAIFIYGETRARKARQLEIEPPDDEPPPGQAAM